jgi:hypothetical protein
MSRISFRALLVCTALAFGLVGCGKDPEPPPKVVAELATQKERARNLEAQKAEEARKREIAEKEASTWKTATMVVVIVSVVALLLGVGIGSRSRRKAEQDRNDR